MSMMRCGCCDGFSDTDDGEGTFEIKGRDYVSQTCLEDEAHGYLDEDTGDIKPEHLSDSAKRDRALHDKGEAMAAQAEDLWGREGRQL
jgi:hypothetical protein